MDSDTLGILGTCGSQWSVLLENLASEGQEEEVRITLLDAELQQTISQELLDRIEPLMSQAIRRKVIPQLIPFGRDDAEQYSILSSIAEAVPSGGKVSFDVTHGFRHLGMVGFLSAFMLERLNKLRVSELWYGALDMTDGGVTPVLKLDGLTRVQSWVDALNRFDATGDYGVFAPLLIQDGVASDKADYLKAAAFFERNLNLKDAERSLRMFRPLLADPLQGASGVFQRRLRERFAWIDEPDFAAQQRKLAFQYLNRGDFVRAAVLGKEAIITQECLLQDKSLHEYSARKEAEEALKAELNEQKHEEWKARAYRNLTDIRNALAHGIPPERKEIQNILKDQGTLRAEIEASLQRLRETERAGESE